MAHRISTANIPYVEGLDIIEQMQEVRTDRSDRPYEDIRIVKATVVE